MYAMIIQSKYQCLKSCHCLHFDLTMYASVFFDDFKLYRDLYPDVFKALIRNRIRDLKKNWSKSKMFQYAKFRICNFIYAIYRFDWLDWGRSWCWCLYIRIRVVLMTGISISINGGRIKRGLMSQCPPRDPRLHILTLVFMEGEGLNLSSFFMNYYDSQNYTFSGVYKGMVRGTPSPWTPL